MPDIKPLTVGDLMVLFKSLPPEMLVLYYNGEYGDYDAIHGCHITDVVENKHCETSYDNAEEDHTLAIKAVILK